MDQPIHPGEILLREFLIPRKMTQFELAKRMNVAPNLVNTLIKGKRDMTSRTAILLSKVFGNRPQYWMHLQVEIDLFEEQKKMQS